MSLRGAFEGVGVARAAFTAAVQAAREGGLSARQIAEEAGCDRRTVAGIVSGRPVSLPPVVYLRGRGARPEDWAEVERLLAGVYVTHDRTQAWHLSRGGHRVVFADFTPGLHGGRYVHVGVVEAKHDDRSGGDDPLRLDVVAGGLNARPERRVRVDGEELPQARLDVPRLVQMVLAHAGVTTGDDDE